MRRFFLTTCLLLVGSLLVSGCSSFTKQGRQQRRYEKYVRKSSMGRVKQQSRFRTEKSQMPSQPMPSEPMESSETSESAPQSMPGDG